MSALFKFIRTNIRHQEIILLSLVAAYFVLQFPLQHHIEISRFQHYSICAYTVVLGFLLQLLFSWRKLTKWGRLALCASAAYLAAFASLFFINPWLDTSVSVQTQAQVVEKQWYAFLFAILGIPVGLVWVRWNVDEFRVTRAIANQ